MSKLDGCLYDAKRVEKAAAESPTESVIPKNSVSDYDDAIDELAKQERSKGESNAEATARVMLETDDGATLYAARLRAVRAEASKRGHAA